MDYTSPIQKSMASWDHYSLASWWRQINGYEVRELPKDYQDFLRVQNIPFENLSQLAIFEMMALHKDFGVLLDGSELLLWTIEDFELALPPHQINNLRTAGFFSYKNITLRSLTGPFPTIEPSPVSNTHTTPVNILTESVITPSSLSPSREDTTFDLPQATKNSQTLCSFISLLTIFFKIGLRAELTERPVPLPISDSPQRKRNSLNVEVILFESIFEMAFNPSFDLTPLANYYNFKNVDIEEAFERITHVISDKAPNFMAKFHLYWSNPNQWAFASTSGSVQTDLQQSQLQPKHFFIVRVACGMTLEDFHITLRRDGQPNIFFCFAVVVKRRSHFVSRCTSRDFWTEYNNTTKRQRVIHDLKDWKPMDLKQAVYAFYQPGPPK